MKKNNIEKLLLIVSLIYTGISVSGCAVLTKPAPPSLPTAQIVSMCKNHIPPEKIIGRIKASSQVFYLNASEIIKLHKQGVCTKVLDYMLKTGIRAKEESAAIMGARNGWWNYNESFCPPAPYYYGPFIPLR